MAFPRKLLNEREELVADLRPHWIFLAPSVTLLVVAIVAGIVTLRYVDNKILQVLVGVLVLASLVYFGLRWAVWATTNFVLTSDRIVSRRGVISKQGIEIPLERVNTVFFHQGVFERIIGAGDLTIESAGERGSETFEDIRRPAALQREIYVQMENNENRRYDRMGAGGGASLSVAEQLEKLHQLMSQGALTPEQFENEKQKLLAQ